MTGGLERMVDRLSGLSGEVSRDRGVLNDDVEEACEAELKGRLPSLSIKKVGNQ
jgi:hypothetical protein